MQTTRLMHSTSTTGLLALFLAACGGQSDEKITADIQAKLNGHPGNAYGKVTVAVQDGTVQLGGECEGSNCADSVAQVAQRTNGVKKVENNIKATDRGTDLTLRTSVQTIVSKYQGVHADVSSGVVVLRGLISRDQLQPLMNELSALNPKKIDNQLAVQ